MMKPPADCCPTKMSLTTESYFSSLLPDADPTSSKRASVEHWNNLRSFSASGRLGIYFPCSMEMMLCRDTPTRLASSSCVMPSRFRCSLTRLISFSFTAIDPIVKHA